MFSIDPMGNTYIGIKGSSLIKWAVNQWDLIGGTARAESALCCIARD